MTDEHTIDWHSAAITHRGNVREYNEDACLARPEEGVWAIADGMGGHHAGDVASREVVAALAKLKSGKDLSSLQVDCRSQLDKVNRALFKKGVEKQAQIIGSTVVAMIAVGDRAAIMWAGDSRAYMYRDGELRQITRDHSRTNELIERGLLKPEAAEDHPESNVITRAVGVAKTLQLEELEFGINVGDVYLVCSDGLSRYLSVDDIKRCMEIRSCNAAVEELLQLTLETEARDNVSAVIVRADEFDGSKTMLNIDVTTVQHDGDPTLVDTDHT